MFRFRFGFDVRCGYVANDDVVLFRFRFDFDVRFVGEIGYVATEVCFHQLGVFCFVVGPRSLGVVGGDSVWFRVLVSGFGCWLRSQGRLYITSDEAVDVTVQEGLQHVLEGVGHGVGPLVCLFRPRRALVLGEPLAGLVLPGLAAEGGKGLGPWRYPVLQGPLQEVPMIVLNHVAPGMKDRWVPGATLLACPSQEVQVLVFSSIGTSSIVPRTGRGWLSQPL